MNKKVTASITATAVALIHLLPPAIAEHSKIVFPLLTAICVGIFIYIVLSFIEEMYNKHTKQTAEQSAKIQEVATKIQEVVSSLSTSTEKICGTVANQKSSIDQLLTANNSLKEVVNTISDNINKVPSKIEQVGNKIDGDIIDAINKLRDTFQNSQSGLADKIEDLSKNVDSNTKSQKQLIRQLEDSPEEISKELSKELKRIVDDFGQKLEDATSPIQAATKLSIDEKKLMEQLVNSLSK